MKSVGLRKIIKKNKNRTLGICAGFVFCFVLCFVFPSVPKNTTEERARGRTTATASLLEFRAADWLWYFEVVNSISCYAMLSHLSMKPLKK